MDDETKYMIKHTVGMIAILALAVFIFALMMLKVLKENGVLE